MSDAAAPIQDEGPLPAMDIGDLEPTPTHDPSTEVKSPDSADNSIFQQAAELGFSESEVNTLGRERVESILMKHEALAFRDYQEQSQQQDHQQAPSQGYPPAPMMQQGQAPAWPVPQSMGQVGVPPGMPQQFVQPGMQQFVQPGMQQFVQHGQQQLVQPGMQQQQFMQPGMQPQQQQQAAPFEVKLDPEMYDEEIVGTLKSMNEHYQTQMQMMQASLQQQQFAAYNQQQMQSQRDFDDHTGWFDRNISELGDDFETVFGKGSADQLPRGSENLRQREEAYVEFTQFLQSKGHPSTTQNDELLKRFVEMRAANDPSFIKKQLSDKLHRGSRQTIGKPSGRKATLEDGGRNPETGLAQDSMDEIQTLIDTMLS